VPYTDTQPPLPWNGETVTSRHTSHQAAVSASKTRVYKSALYLQWLRRVGRGSDHDASDQLGWPLSSINSIRNGLGKAIEPAGITVGKYGKKVALWRAVSTAHAAAGYKARSTTRETT